jgi:hypothetical protein
MGPVAVERLVITEYGPADALDAFELAGWRDALKALARP